MTVTATLVPGQSPQLVQIVVDEIPDGVAWSLRGTIGGVTEGTLPGDSLLPGDELLPADSVFTAGSYSWTVPGGYGIGDGGQVVLVDNRSPGNLPYVYELVLEGAVERSNSVVVPFQRDIVLQTLDGQATVDLDLMAGSLDFELPANVSQFRVPGRSRPVVRYDVLGDILSRFVVKVPMDQTADMRRVLTSGAPIVYRFGAPEGSFDLDPVGVIAVTQVQPEAFPTASMRLWSLGYTLIDDPNADVRLGAYTWDAGFDAALAGSSWNDFNARFSGLDWDSFDSYAWVSA